MSGPHCSEKLCKYVFILKPTPSIDMYMGSSTENGFSYYKERTQSFPELLPPSVEAFRSKHVLTLSKRPMHHKAAAG